MMAAAAVPRTSARDSHSRSNSSAADVASLSAPTHARGLLRRHLDELGRAGFRDIAVRLARSEGGPAALNDRIPLIVGRRQSLERHELLRPGRIGLRLLEADGNEGL